MPAAEAVETLDGWYCLHDFRSVNWSAWKKLLKMSANKRSKSLIN